MAEDLKERALRLPKKPGIYLFKNDRGEILYVGKAQSLRNRVLSYFQPTSDPKVHKILNESASVEFILTGSEKEALLLENNFIQSHQPRFNLRLKDDKSYPYLKLTVKDRFPGIYLCRKVLKGRARYYGPFSPALHARSTIRILNKYFGIRSCEEEIPSRRRRPCLEYDLKLCPAPCVGIISEEEYGDRVRQARMFLEGRTEELLKILRERMTQAANEENFEQAAHWRDMTLAIEQVKERPRFTSTGMEDADIAGFHREERKAGIYLFTMRKGKVTEAEEHILDTPTEKTDGEILAFFLSDYYQGGRQIPGRLILPFEPAKENSLLSALKELKGGLVRIVVPKLGKDKKIVRLACHNAEILLQKKQEQEGELPEWRRLLAIDRVPRRIEGYDISNTGGGESVGSTVVFEDGKPFKNDYRKFKIKSVEGPNDVASLQEVILRRYGRVIEEGGRRPDLILVDGGLSQLHAAEAALKALGLQSIPLTSLAKREEIIYSREHHEGVRLDRTSPVLKLLQAVRDEAHRFAITFHRKRRAEKSFASELDGIRGLGPKRKAALLKRFGSVEAIKNASIEDLATVVGRKTAELLSCSILKF